MLLCSFYLDHEASVHEENCWYKLGNIIQNMQDQALTGRIDMIKLYNKIGFLKGINTPKKKLTPKELAAQAKNTRPDTVRRPPELGALKGLLRRQFFLRCIDPFQEPDLIIEFYHINPTGQSLVLHILNDIPHPETVGSSI